MIGGGPVGLALADALVSRGVEVVVLESGGFEPRPETPEPDRAETFGDPYGDLRDQRVHAVGGMATIWNTILHGVPMAKYVPLDALDFEERPWIPHSGWPFGRDALVPWYERAHEVCGLGRFRADAVADGAGYALLDFPPRSLVTRVFDYGPASRFTRDLPENLRRAAGARLVTGATVTGLVTDGGGSSVRRALWTTPEGRRGTVDASAFVLAAGAVENARLLLLAREREGLSATGGWLGAGFMEHPVDTSLELVTRDPALSPPEGFYSPHGVGRSGTVVGRIALSEELLRAEALPNASIRLVHQEEPAVLETPALAAVGRRLVPLAGLRRLLRSAARRARRSSGRMVGTRYRVWVDLEQAPAPHNRVTLSDRRDPFGRPSERLHWRWSEEDEARRRRVLGVVARELERAGVGRVREVAPGALDPNAHHHAGTTRAHDDPSRGVVDENLRVHGTANLHVAGSSVFPTAGYANPTLTAIALALRLASHLAADA